MNTTLNVLMWAWLGISVLTYLAIYGILREILAECQELSRLLSPKPEKVVERHKMPSIPHDPKRDKIIRDKKRKELREKQARITGDE